MLSILLLLGACASDPWSKEEKATYLNECRAEGAGHESCECMLEETMKRYPNYEKAEQVSFEEMVEIAEICE